MKKSFILFLSVILTVLLFNTGCATKQESSEPVEQKYDFVADIDSFDIGSFNLLVSHNLTDEKITEIFLSFSPRTNCIIGKARIGANLVSFTFDYEQRIKMLDAVNQYKYEFENGKLTNRKPTKKNAYFIDKSFVSWGMLGYGHDVTTEFFTNVEFLEPTKPYFKIQFLSQEEPGYDDVYSPRFSIFISPSQWDKIIQACNQEDLEKKSTQVVDEAYEF